MPEIDVRGVGVTYPGGAAITDVTFAARSGRITGLLGPNGAGKSTVLRVMVGAQRGTGEVLFSGRPYRDQPDPGRTIGVMLDAGAFYPGHTARTHLEWLCAGRGLDRRSAGRALELVGLQGVAQKKVRGFSLGMRQRLGIAAAVMGDPEFLVLDEPGNGLDPEGMQWLRGFLDRFAAGGGCVLVASHQLHDLEEIVDDVVVMLAGRVVVRSTLADFLAADGCQVTVRCDDLDTLTAALHRLGGDVEHNRTHLRVHGVRPSTIGTVAREAGVTLHELSPAHASLERAYLRLVTAGPGPVAGHDARGPAAPSLAEVAR